MSQDDEGYRGVREAVERVRERMAAACARAGRPASAARLMAVTKFHPYGAVEAAYASGVRLFGENRVQEAEEKFAGGIPAGAELHLIGSLQSNKAAKAARLFSCVQSVDSLKLVAELAKRAANEGKVLDILLELHTGEESKSGFRDSGELFRACDALADIESLEPRGLMTMAPFTQDEAVVRRSFRALAQAFVEVQNRYGFPLFRELSMGMTNDYEIAIEEGATIVRVGTAIFGKRA